MTAYQNFLIAETKFSRPFWHTNEVMKARCLYKMGKVEEAKKCAHTVKSHPWPVLYYPKHSIARLDGAIKKLL